MKQQSNTVDELNSLRCLSSIAMDEEYRIEQHTRVLSQFSATFYGKCVKRFQYRQFLTLSSLDRHTVH